MPQTPVIDVHNHIIPPVLLDTIRSNRLQGLALRPSSSGREELLIGDRNFGALSVERSDPESRVRSMDQMGVAIQALTLIPPLVSYHLPGDRGLELSRTVNDALAQIARDRPDRFVSLGTVPLQDPSLAVPELRRAINELGMRGVLLAGNVEGVNLGDERFLPFWEAVAELDCFVLVHPTGLIMPGTDRMAGYHLRNTIGNPLDTSLTMMSLIYGGHLERWPNLKICFCHAGGFIPYQIGRFDHAYRVRSKAEQVIPKQPSHYFKQLYFDTIAHSDDSLRFLVSKVGADHVLLGTDYPADMGDTDPLGTISRLNLSPEDRALVVGGTAARLLKMG